MVFNVSKTAILLKKMLGSLMSGSGTVPTTDGTE